MADKLKAVCLRGPKRWRPHPDLPDDDDAMQYKVLVKDVQKHKKRTLDITDLKVNAHVEAKSARLLSSMLGVSRKTRPTPAAIAAVAECGDRGESQLAVANTAQPFQADAVKEEEEKKAEAEKKAAEEQKQKAEEDAKRDRDIEMQRRKNERKAALEKAKKKLDNDPLHQATQWISGAAALNVKLTEYIKEAGKATKLPGSTGKAYKTSFEGHQKSLMEIREKLEKNMTSKKQLKIEMVAATCLVETMTDDLHAFSTLFRSYYGRKPEDKAKA